jgi:myosin heavy subunit
MMAPTGILHLGQVQFESRTDLSGESGVIADPEPLVLAARLLGVERDQLETALVKKKSLVIRGTNRDQVASGLFLAELCAGGALFY